MRALVWAVLALVACGGGNSEPPRSANDREEVGDPYGESGSSEAAPAANATETPSEAPESDAAPGSVMVKIKVGGAEVAGHVQILGEDGRVVSEGDAPFTARIPAGTYTFTGQITDESVLVDRPTHRSEGIEVRPGGPQDVIVDVPRAQVHLIVVRGGRQVRNAEVSLMRPGNTEPVYRYHPGARHISISAGRYEADVKMGTQVIHVNGITFMEGATQDVPIEIN